jgi:uncharacterized membrane protein
MDVRPPYGKQLFAAVVFLASTLVLALQLVNPSPVVVSVGENGTDVAELGQFFQYQDVAIIAVSACLLGASGSYLLLGPEPREDTSSSDLDSQTEPVDEEQAPSEELLDARRQEWEETAERLANNEETIYRVVLDADGVIAQNDIVEETDLSKATVSRTLDSLETKDLIERKRRGMGNMVLLL